MIKIQNPLLTVPTLLLSTLLLGGDAVMEGEEFAKRLENLGYSKKLIELFLYERSKLLEVPGNLHHPKVEWADEFVTQDYKNRTIAVGDDINAKLILLELGHSEGLVKLFVKERNKLTDEFLKKIRSESSTDGRNQSNYRRRDETDVFRMKKKQFRGESSKEKVSSRRESLIREFESKVDKLLKESRTQHTGVPVHEIIMDIIRKQKELDEKWRNFILYEGERVFNRNTSEGARLRSLSAQMSKLELETSALEQRLNTKSFYKFF